MNYTVILAGDKNHGEVVGIAGYAGKKFILVENKEDAEKLCKELNRRFQICVKRGDFS